MKTKYILASLRNSTSPAARLALWQNRPIARRMKTLESAEPGHRLALRQSIISGGGPELSSPDAERPLLWLSGTSDYALDGWTAGRDFLNHCGCYADEFQDETLETYAVSLSAFPGIMFYAVLSWGGLRVELNDWQEVDFTECQSHWDADEARRECARDTIRSNDSSTQREAEEAIEFSRKDQAERDIEENRETLKAIRVEIRELAHELRTLCPSPLASQYPAASKALLTSLRALLADRRELMATNEKLAASL